MQMRHTRGWLKLSDGENAKSIDRRKIFAGVAGWSSSRGGMHVRILSHCSKVVTAATCQKLVAFQVVLCYWMHACCVEPVREHC